MTTQLETDQDIRDAISAKAIALKLVEGSENAKMFTRIYPEKPAPTVYLISHLGVLLTSFSNSLDSKESFIGKLNESSVASKPPAAESAAPAEQSASSSDQTKQADSKSIEAKKQELIQRIKENCEKNKKLEEERAKNQEVERIRAGKYFKTNNHRLSIEEMTYYNLNFLSDVQSEGKEMQKLKQQIAEQEAKEAIKEREKDAILGKLERERVLRALEEDQREKKERFELESKKREEEYQKYKKSEEEKNSTLKNRVIKLAEDEIRIQFKLPDASSLVTKFKLNDSLQNAIEFVKENSRLQSFQLAITYPKRNFTEQDFATTFTDLGIKNSAVFLVVELSSGTADKVATDSVFNQIWAAVLSVYTIVFTMIAGLFGNLFGNAGSQPPAAGSSSADNSNKPSTSKFTERDNFRTLRNDRRDGDEDRNTYNGNSTEQQ